MSIKIMKLVVEIVEDFTSALYYYVKTSSVVMPTDMLFLSLSNLLSIS